jgi:hypothetical protein
METDRFKRSLRAFLEVPARPVTHAPKTRWRAVLKRWQMATKATAPKYHRCKWLG